MVAATGASHLSSQVLVGPASLLAAKCHLLSLRCLQEAPWLCYILPCLLDRPALSSYSLNIVHHKISPGLVLLGSTVQNVQAHLLVKLSDRFLHPYLLCIDRY